MHFKVTHHNGQIMSVVVRQGTIAAHDKVLGTQKVLQVLWMIPYDLCDMVKLYLFHVVCVVDVLQGEEETEKCYLDGQFKIATE